MVAAAPALAAAPAPDARAYILVNPDTGEVLAARNPDVRLPMASTTKMMTALVVVANSDPDETAVVPPAAAAVGESSAGLVAGERLRIRDLLTGLMIGSGNDAAITLAQHVAGSQGGFVGMMNARARSLGLTRTHYANPHGLDAPGHHTSVRDLVTLGEAVMARPELRAIVRNRRGSFPGPNGVGTRYVQSKNTLLDIDPDADGIKTGDTDGAGYALAAHARRAHLGVQLYGALIGAPSEQARARDMKRLLDWGFRQYASVALTAPGTVVARLPMRHRDGVGVDVAVGGAVLRAPVRLGRPVTETYSLPTAVTGDVRRGQALGRMVVRQGDRVLGTRTLVAAADVQGPGLLDDLRAGVGGIIP